MKDGLRKLVIKYLTEAKNSKATEEDFAVMADNFVADVERLISARKDFKED